LEASLQQLHQYLTRRARSAGFSAVALTLAICLALVAPQVALAAAKPSDSVDGITAAKRKLALEVLPDVTMQAGALVDADGRVLWGRSADKRRPMASITKIMTAIVALEHSSLDESVVIPKASVSVGESTASLRAGEKLSMREVLQALLVKSGNDAAIAVAQHVAGSEAGFVDLMNAKAQELGLKDTHFTNPHGLDQPGHYTTANDLAVLARYAMANPRFREIVSMKTVTIGSGKRKETLQSTDELLGNYPGAMGVKTGYTSGAGYSVVSAATRGGITLYAIVLGTSSDAVRFREARELLDWGYAHYRPTQIADGGTIVAEAPVVDYLDRTVPAQLSQDTTVPVLDLDGPITRTLSVNGVTAPVAVGDRVGEARYTQGGRLIATVPLLATQAAGRPNPVERLWIAIVRAWRKVTG
jgi:serine-type D-Ala-D-Ala carboxypeptidase (penicillin-binding protein 5/6)